MIDYSNQATLLAPTRERPTRSTSELLLEDTCGKYQSTPTRNPYCHFQTDSQDKANVLYHGQAYGKPTQGKDRGLQQRNDPHNGIDHRATEPRVDIELAQSRF